MPKQPYERTKTYLNRKLVNWFGVGWANRKKGWKGKDRSWKCYRRRQYKVQLSYE